MTEKKSGPQLEAGHLALVLQQDKSFGKRKSGVGKDCQSTPEQLNKTLWTISINLVSNESSQETVPLMP
jgi:hypothetical protein